MSSPSVGLKGSQTPRIESYPAYFTSAADDVIDLGAVAGVIPDPWQEYVLRRALGEQKGTGKWSALEVALIVARQNGKNIVLLLRELGGLFLFGERYMLHTAHTFKTANAAFRKTAKIIEDTPALAEMILGYEGPDAKARGIRTAHGFESIELKNGARLDFATRTPRGIRGETIDFLALDEAFALTDAHMGSVLPTLGARTMTANPQVWYTSSAGMPAYPVLRRIRDRGINGAEGLAFFEWSAPDDADPADPRSWAQANPAMNIRISESFIRSEYEGGMDEEQFKREVMGIWDSATDDPPLFSPEEWAACLDEKSEPSGKIVFAIDVMPNREAACIAVAGRREDELMHVEVAEIQQGTDWVAPWLAERVRRYRGSRVIIDAGSAAGSLQANLNRHKVPFTLVGMRDYAQGCGLVYDAIKEARLRHIGQIPLDDAIDAARMKPLGDSLWKWLRKNVVSSISPLVAVTLAYLGADRFLALKPTESTGSRVLIL